MHNNSTVPQATVLITGASSGIGYELAKVFAHDEFDLVLVARDAPRLAQIAEELRGSFPISVTVIPKDLAHATAADCSASCNASALWWTS